MSNSIQDLRDTYAKIAFIHTKLLATQFYPEEFNVADASIKMLTKMANDLADDIRAREESVNGATQVVEAEIVESLNE